MSQPLRNPTPADEAADNRPALRLHVAGDDVPTRGLPHQPLFYNEIEVGQQWQSPARTITETDLIMFAGLTGDFNPLHVDHEYARQTPFGRPIAHGLFGMSLVAGLGSHSPWMKTEAFTRIVEWKFLKPMYVGDTVRVETTVEQMQPHGRRRGLVTWRRRLLNHAGEIVQEGIAETLVLADPEWAKNRRGKPPEKA